MADATSDPVQRASDELYGIDPAQFVARRAALEREARAAGDPGAARLIAALHKPTRSAWTANSLVRSDPDLLNELIELGDQLRVAESSLDGEQLRELSRRRGQLVESLTRAAFVATRQGNPASAIGEEVRATLSAAVADADIARQLTSGTLLRAARWDGFGSAMRADLSLVPGPRRPKPTTSSASKKAASPPAARSHDDEELERDQRVEQRIAAATTLVDDIERDLSAAERAEHDRVRRLHELETQLDDARCDLDRTRADVRLLRTKLRSARQQLSRLGR